MRIAGTLRSKLPILIESDRRSFSAEVGAFRVLTCSQKEGRRRLVIIGDVFDFTECFEWIGEVSRLMISKPRILNNTGRTKARSKVSGLLTRLPRIPLHSFRRERSLRNSCCRSRTKRSSVEIVFGRKQIPREMSGEESLKQTVIYPARRL